MIFCCGSDKQQILHKHSMQMQQPEGLEGTPAFTSQRLWLQVADSALMNVDTSEHTQYIPNQHSRSTVKQCRLRQRTKSKHRSFEFIPHPISGLSNDQFFCLYVSTRWH